ncbi:hypothetical protein [Methylorubrum populi]|uniref:hypothetical protein n=1 Tax=Methylorubrum populi TaxID=223967 RepID=UPI000DAF66C3|nr:hypothetical protein [Methylorubrum populi]PZP71775.1 MAG: hypothetical protein DI590_05805 [Methylorubrum populi]
MSKPFHTTVHVDSIKNEMFNRSMAFAIPDGLKGADVLGRLVEPDPTINCGMRLLRDGEAITASTARIDVYEDRGLITAQFRFSDLVPILEGDALKAGDVAVGAGNGFVKKGVAGSASEAFVAEIREKNGKKYASLVKL